ncbi:17908_t:CDS:1, partial [Gigaspora rosea]
VFHTHSDLELSGLVTRTQVVARVVHNRIDTSYGNLRKLSKLCGLALVGVYRLHAA